MGEMEIKVNVYTDGVEEAERFQACCTSGPTHEWHQHIFHQTCKPKTCCDINDCGCDLKCSMLTSFLQFPALSYVTLSPKVPLNLWFLFLESFLFCTSGDWWCLLRERESHVWPWRFLAILRSFQQWTDCFTLFAFKLEKNQEYFWHF